MSHLLHAAPHLLQPLVLQQGISKDCWKWISYHICSDIFSHLEIVLDPSNQTCHFPPPCPDRSRYRLCVSLPSNISSVYLPLSFSVGLKISIQTFCVVLPVFVLASWSTLLSLHGRKTYENHILIKDWILQTSSCFFPWKSAPLVARLRLPTVPRSYDWFIEKNKQCIQTIVEN